MAFPTLERRFFSKPRLSTLNLDYLVQPGRAAAARRRPAGPAGRAGRPGRFALYLGRRRPAGPRAVASAARRAHRSRAERLPGAIVDRLPSPEIEWLVVGHKPDGKPVCTRLARYRDRACSQRDRRKGRPGAADPRLQRERYHLRAPRGARQPRGDARNAGRDVWVLDMRSSAGLPHGNRRVVIRGQAESDIPMPSTHPRRHRQREARCRRALHGQRDARMAVLGDAGNEDRLQPKIGRVVMSQVGPG